LQSEAHKNKEVDSASINYRPILTLLFIHSTKVWFKPWLLVGLNCVLKQK